MKSMRQKSPSCMVKDTCFLKMINQHFFKLCEKITNEMFSNCELSQLHMKLFSKAVKVR